MVNDKINKQIEILKSNNLSNSQILSIIKSFSFILGDSPSNEQSKIIRELYWRALINSVRGKYKVYSLKISEHSPLISGIYTIVSYGLNYVKGKAIYSKENDSWIILNNFPEHIEDHPERVMNENELKSLYWIN